MKKYFIFTCGFAFGLCAALLLTDMGSANAQNSNSAVVGNPDSNNTVMIEETYGIVSTTAPQAAVPNAMQPPSTAADSQTAPTSAPMPEIPSDHPSPDDIDAVEINESVEND